MNRSRWVADIEEVELNGPSGRIEAVISNGTANDVDRAVAAARKAATGWRAMPPAARGRIWHAIADAAEAHVEELAALESLNAGKPVMVARAEMAMIGDLFRFMAGAARALQTPAAEEYVSGRSLRVASALNFGTVWVNAHLVLATEMPWGGYKSGHGRELSTLSLEDFSRTNI